MPNKVLSGAKKEKNDEFYTQYNDIQREINAYTEYNPNVFKDKIVLLPCDDPEWSNFTKLFAQQFKQLGLKKLISTSFAVESKNYKEGYQPTSFEKQSPSYNRNKTRVKGKIFVLDRDKNGDGRIDINDLDWKYLQGDGDFRSDEVTRLRDQADIIITNPPFSLFREFLAWLIEKDNEFLIIGNSNVISYKEVFPLIRNNRMWLGATGSGKDMVFGVPKGTEVSESDRKKAEKLGYKGDYTRMGNCCWFTNIEHGRRHQYLDLMTMEDNLRYATREGIKERGYVHYDNYDAIDVPFVKNIPSDYEGAMGVPITFLEKYCPEQFEIIALGNGRENFTPNKDYINPQKVKKGKILNGNAINCVLAIETATKPEGIYYISDNSKYLVAPYARIIKKK
jgi:hypothetical protein